MTGWLDPLRAALDAAEEPVPFFFRDDDAGWDDDALAALLDVFERHGMPLDVAAIPTETTARTAALLRRRGGDVRVHQHGYAHVNHEAEGRKCEFGASRAPEQQRADVDRGRRLLAELVGDLPSLFTPPWNRCADWTPAVLRDLGFGILSRDLSAGRADVPGLAEVPVTVDWFAKRRKVPVDRDGRGGLLAQSAATGGPVGVMLHHAVTSAEERADVSDLLALVAAHPAATTVHLDALAARVG
ncbi:MAG: polysaccharide deacetylase family protein [Nocardioidaceae bacterium]|nr:polysaccharide deacetylase family protein [Nocardioidaceae bacterium]